MTHTLATQAAFPAEAARGAQYSPPKGLVNALSSAGTLFLGGGASLETRNHSIGGRKGVSKSGTDS